MERPSIYRYLSFKPFLKEMIEYLKMQDSSFSQRTLAEKGGFGLGLLTKIISGERTLTARMLVTLCDLLHISSEEEHYFELLVSYEQARSESEKIEALRELMAVKQEQIRTIDVEQYAFYDQWFYPVIRELIGIGAFTGDYGELGAKLLPPIGARPAKKAVETLKKLDLIREENGKLVVSDSLISTGYDTTSTAVNIYVCSMMDRAKASMDLCGKAERNLGTICFSVSEQRIPELIEQIRRFRRELLETAKMDSDADRIYQLGIQLFPVSGGSK